MDNARLVHELSLRIENIECLIEIFSRPNGTHFARTVFAPDDVIINEGCSYEEALHRHRDLLPLAVHSRLMRRNNN